MTPTDFQKPVWSHVRQTAYTLFEDLAERLHLAVHTILGQSEHDRLGVVGLRYIDVVRASGGRELPLLPAAGPPRSGRRSVPAWPTPPSHREQRPRHGRRKPRYDGRPHRSERPGVVAAAGSRGRRAELPAKDGGRELVTLRRAPLRRGELRCRCRLGGGPGLRTDRGEVGGFGVETRAIGALSTAGQVRKFQAALSVNSLNWGGFCGFLGRRFTLGWMGA